MSRHPDVTGNSGDPDIRAVATTALELIDVGEGMQLDITVDGVDEVAPKLDLVKGWSGALVRERTVATPSGRVVILAGEEKLVHGLGQRGPAPVEVIPFARWLAAKKLRELGLAPALRTNSRGSGPLLPDTGLLLDTADLVLVGHPDGRVDTLRPAEG